VRRLARAAVAAALALLAPAGARAQPESYFEPRGFHPEGFTFGIFGQGGGFLSTSCCDLGGRRGAGGGGLRIGTAATPRLLWVVQSEGATVLIEEAGGGGKNNTHGTLTLGAQYYLLHTLWVHGGLGFATYRIVDSVQETQVVDLERNGFAYASAVGFDLFRSPDFWSFGFRRQDLAVSFEVRVVGALYPGATDDMGMKQKIGGILQITSGFGLQWY
jgi:hypothetical protein